MNVLDRRTYLKRLRGRNLALLAVIVGVVAILYVLPFVRFGGR
jgi:hypothetical protein